MDEERATASTGQTGPTFHDVVHVAVAVVGMLVAALVVQLSGALTGPALAVALGVLAVAAVLVVAVVLRLLFDPHVVRTAGGLALVRNVAAPDGSRVRVLNQGGVYQSATYLDERRFKPVFAYQCAFELLFEAEDAVRAATGHGVDRVLTLGGGGYAWPKYTLTRHAELMLDVVEVDPAITAAARRWFFLDELEAQVGERLRLIAADGRAYLDERCARQAPPNDRACSDDPAAESVDPAVSTFQRYDAIVNDTFSGREPVHALATVEAARAAKGCLTPCGIYLTNVVSADEGTDLTFLRDEVATLSEVFAYVSVIPAIDDVWGGEENYLLIASDLAYTFSGTIPFDADFLGTALHD